MRVPINIKKPVPPWWSARWCVYFGLQPTEDVRSFVTLPDTLSDTAAVPAFFLHFSC